MTNYQKKILAIDLKFDYLIYAHFVDGQLFYVMMVLQTY